MDDVDLNSRYPELPLDIDVNVVNNVMSNFPNGYTYKIHDKKVLVKEVTDKDTAEKWIKDFQLFSNTSWTKCRTYKPSGSRVVFKIRLKCHFNVQIRSTCAVDKRKPSKNMDCPAFLLITVFKSLVKSRSARNIDPQYPCCIDFSLDHNCSHLNNGLVVRPKKMTEETREKLLDLYRKGHNHVTARDSLKLDLYLINIENYSERAADHSFVPSLKTTRNLFFNTFRNMCGEKSSDDMDQDLANLVDTYNRETEDGRAVFGMVDHHKFVAMCTPIMSRAHRILPQASDQLHVVPYRNEDKDKPRVYMFSTPGLPGGVPLGCIVTEVKSKDVFHEALRELVKIMPAGSFHGNTSPRVIMTDDDQAERDSLKEVWSEAILLLDHLSVLRAHWKWVLIRDSHFEPVDKESMYLSFKKLVYAPSIDEFEQLYKVHCEKFRKYPSYIKYICAQYARREEWAMAYRNNFPIWGGNLSHYIETVFRTIKESILERVKSFNYFQLVDFMLIRYESYMRKTLTDLADKKYCKALTEKYMPRALHDVDVTKIETTVDDHTNFYVPSAKVEGVLYLVDAKHGFCNCPTGKGDNICEHLGAVLHYYCLTDDMFVVYALMRAAALAIASGDQRCPSRVLAQAVQPAGTSGTSDSASQQEDDVDQDNTDYDENEIIDEIGSDDLPQKLESDELSVVELDKLNDLFERIASGTQTNPNLFLPAVRKMLENIDNFVKTDSALASAMRNFSRNTERAETKFKREELIEMHPKPVTGRGKRPLELQNHDYALSEPLYFPKKPTPEDRFCVVSKVSSPL